MEMLKEKQMLINWATTSESVPSDMCPYQKISISLRIRIIQADNKYTGHTTRISLRKHAYSDIENFTSKNWRFSDKNSNIFYISAQNIDCVVLVRTASSRRF